MTSLIAIYEPNLDGHRLSYVQHLVDFAFSQGSKNRVVLLGADSTFESAQAKTLRDAYDDRFSFVTAVDLKAGLAWARSNNAESMVLPDGDLHLTSLARCRRNALPANLSVLLMRSKLQMSPKYWKANVKILVKLALAAFLSSSKQIKVARLTDPVSRFWMFKTCPDPVDVTSISSSARSILLPGWTSESFSIGVVGAIDRRKNLELISRAFMQYAQASTLVVAGRIDSNYFQELTNGGALASRDGKKILVRNEIIPENQLNSIVSQLDVVAIALSNNAPSGILLKCLALGTPVVASGSAILKKLAKKYPHNIVFVNPKAQSISQGFLSAQKLDSPPVPLASPREFARVLLGK